MPPARTRTRNGNGGQTVQAPPAPSIPFIDGTYEYTDTITTVAITPAAAQQELPVIQITPGGYLRGVTFRVTSAGGALGGGALAADAPWTVFQYLTLESIDGTPVLYPQSGYSWYLSSRFMRPWDGDPELQAGFSNTVNPAFTLRLFNELRATLGCLANTDARAQYRIRGAIAPLTSLVVGGAPTGPLLTINVDLEVYAQPPATALTGAEIQQMPDGIGVQRFVSSESGVTLNTGTNSIKLNRTGNLIRNHILVVRTSAGARTDLTADPIRFRVDNTQLFVESRAHRDYQMWLKYQVPSGPSIAATARPTGVYVFDHWQDPGRMVGQGWLPTTEATYVQYELNGGPAAGTLQVITEDLAPAGQLPAYLEHI